MDMARETHHRPSEEKLRHHQFMDVRTLTLTTLLMLRRSFRFWSRSFVLWTRYAHDVTGAREFSGPKQSILHAGRPNYGLKGNAACGKPQGGI